VVGQVIFNSSRVREVSLGFGKLVKNVKNVWEGCSSNRGRAASDDFATEAVGASPVRLRSKLASVQALYVGRLGDFA
jgi:hypothetical protein